MATFTYTAIDPDTRRPQKGTIEALNSDLAENELIERGLEILGIAELKEPTNVEDLIAKFRPVPLKALVSFTRQLATMNTAGMPLLESLTGLADSQPNPKFKEQIEDIIRQVNSGMPLYDAVARHPETFDTRYVAMLRAGDKAGNMSKSLNELAKDLEKRSTMDKAIKSATVYPKVIGGAAFMILSMLMIFMVPKFANIFQETAKSTCATGKTCSSDLPALTEVVRKISGLLYPPFSASPGWFGSVALRFMIAFGLIMLIRMFIRRTLRKPGPRERWDAFKLRAPMKVGPLVQKIAVARFARTYSSLLKSGITATEALPIVADTAGNKIVADAVRQARQDMFEGKPLYVPLAQSGAFPPNVIHMIKSGEDSGKVDEMMDHIAKDYEEEVDLAIKGLSSIIEPMMIILVGGMIGVVVIALYLPMFKMYDNIG